MRFCIAPEVFEKWPEYRRCTVVGRGLENAEDDPALLAPVSYTHLDVYKRQV